MGASGMVRVRLRPGPNDAPGAWRQLASTHVFAWSFDASRSAPNGRATLRRVADGQRRTLSWGHAETGNADPGSSGRATSGSLPIGADLNLAVTLSAGGYEQVDHSVCY